jgi:hypothetical protein
MENIGGCGCGSVCGCCEGVEKLTPMNLANRPGLRALSYRAGTYATFFETMVARLSNLTISTGEFDASGDPVILRPLLELTTREESDPAIALLDAWAVVGDVLTFYDERIANEGYLQTATERRSVLELARLIGYAPRPGVSATAYLAYTIEEDRSVTPPKGMEVVIPAGSRAQSVPEPKELPQPFETAEALRARTAWNKLQPRRSEPLTLEWAEPDTLLTNELWLKGTATNLKPNDPILIVLGTKRVPRRVGKVEADIPADRTHITLRPWWGAARAAETMVAVAAHHAKSNLAGLTADRAREILGKFEEAASEHASDPRMLSEFAERETLPALTGLAQKVHRRAKKLKPFLDETVEQLASAHMILRQSLVTDAHGVVPATPKQVEPFFDALKKAPSVPPRSVAQLGRSLRTAFTPGADAFPRLLGTFQKRLADILQPALTNASVAPAEEIEVYALRVSAGLFAHNAPARPIFGDPQNAGKITGYDEPDIIHAWGEIATRTRLLAMIPLEAEYDQIQPDSFMVVERPPLTVIPDHAVILDSGNLTIHTVAGTTARTLSAFGVSSKVTLAMIKPPWMSEWPLPATGTEDLVERAKQDTGILRGTRVYAQSELLPLAESPITEAICDAEIELEGVYDGLEAGRWVVLAGERHDVLDTNCKPVPGIQAAELAMILSVSHRVRRLPNEQLAPPGPVMPDGLGPLPADFPSPIGESTGYGQGQIPKPSALPGDKTHTYITLSEKPAYCYVRDKLTIYGNVVKATHGETRREVLGSSDASKPMQSFTLRQPPLTFLPAPTPAGATSTLVLRVNEVQWHETDSLAGLAPDDRKFITKTDDESKATVVFGNGHQGARPPTGRENITAVYRNGIGQPGNVKAGQISQLATRPLGVKEVVNPLPTSGGADREGRDQIKKNAPLGVLALDRLVSVKDYADFTRTFAGIGKASAVKLSDGAREVIHVTIAGADDIAIDPISDLYKMLVRALRDLGDPHLVVEVKPREMLSLIIAANVGVLPDYAWEFVEPKIRAALFETFSFERRDLAQDVTRSEVITAIQRVRGVAFADLDVLAVISESQVEAELVLSLNAGAPSKSSPSFLESHKGVPHRVVVEPARANSKATEFSKRILPAQLAVLSPALPETVVLTEVKS